jgi:hypothetical protein
MGQLLQVEVTLVLDLASDEEVVVDVFHGQPSWTVEVKRWPSVAYPFHCVATLRQSYVESESKPFKLGPLMVTFRRVGDGERKRNGS